MYFPKVLDQQLPNNIPQMKSGKAQAPFIAGGNQVAYYLGLRGNNITSEMPKTESYSSFEKIIKKQHKK